MMICFKCEKEMTSIFEENVGEPPYPSGGLLFKSPGNYGSTVFDPYYPSSSRRQELVIYLCDECVVNNNKLVQLLRSTVYTETEVEMNTWDPNEECG